MLNSISIRDIVLIERLDLEFAAGLCVLTGETGAGKSILLDALSLALGSRGDVGLVRKGADQGVVSAAFSVSKDHPVHSQLDDLAILPEDAELILRRVLGKDGRSRGFINGQPVSVATLREIGEQLVEIHGQHDARGLLQPSNHRVVLDRFSKAEKLAHECAKQFSVLRELEKNLTDLRESNAKAKEEEDYLRHALAELELLAPQSGEETALVSRRALLKESQRINEGLQQALARFSDGDGPEEKLRGALRDLQRLSEQAAGGLDNAIELLDQAVETAAHAQAAIENAGTELDLNPSSLEEVEDRLFALRDVARKHRVGVDALADLKAKIDNRLVDIDLGEEEITRLSTEMAQSRAEFEVVTVKLSKKRHDASKKLNKAILKELSPLAMEKARFETLLETLDSSEWGPNGSERVQFRFSTNSGVPTGPLNKIASGGELSRLMLALKVALRANGTNEAMVFDEVDTGVGGATAAKVGERLLRLSSGGQVLVVTHSPQVAARGQHHYLIEKHEENGRTITDVARLQDDARTEEVARMLAGARVTDEARAAAERLMEGKS